jgi:hypothetical protein
LGVFQSLGVNSNSDVYVITAISKHLSPGKLVRFLKFELIRWAGSILFIFSGH